MEPSDNKTLMERLSIVQQHLKVPKGQRNSFGNYNYRNAEDILEAVKPLLSEQGLTLVLSDELIKIGDRYYVKASAVLEYGTHGPDKGGRFVEITAYAREEEAKKGMDGSQITGASSSYARKYALNGLFLIDDTRDSDATNEGSKVGEPAESKPVSKFIKRDRLERYQQLMLARELVGPKAITYMLTSIGKERPDTPEEVEKLIEALEASQ